MKKIVIYQPDYSASLKACVVTYPAHYSTEDIVKDFYERTMGFIFIQALPFYEVDTTKERNEIRLVITKN